MDINLCGTGCLKPEEGVNLKHVICIYDESGAYLKHILKDVDTKDPHYAVMIPLDYFKGVLSKRIVEREMENIGDILIDDLIFLKEYR